MPKVLIIVSSPGPAESLALVVKKMRNIGSNVELITTNSRALKGIFNNIGIEYREANEFGNIQDPLNIPEDFVNKIINSVRPDTILTDAYRDTTGMKLTLDDMIIFCAKRRGIPVFQYVEMWDNWFPKKSLNLIPDIFLVQDKLTQKDIIKKGGEIPDSKFILAGNPGLEKFLQDKTKHKRFGKKDLGFDNKRVIAYFGQCSQKNEISFPWTVDCLKHSKNDVLIFSRHPRDERDFKKFLEYPNVVESEKLEISCNDDILDFCDICITHTSTMGMKAALLGIKTINVILDNDFVLDSGRYPLAEMGGSQQANNEQELGRAIEKEFIISDNFKQISQEFIAGNSLNKIVELLK